MNNTQSNSRTSSSSTATPIYQRRSATGTADDSIPGMFIAGMPNSGRLVDGGDSYNSGRGPVTADTIRRTLGSSEVISTASSSRFFTPTTNPNGQTPFFTPPQTPWTASTRDQVAIMSPRVLVPPEANYFPNQPTQAPLMAPSISAMSTSSITPSPLLRQNPFHLDVKMEIETSKTSHTLLAPLGDKFTSDSITIAAKKNNVLQIMADRWDQEKDCHVEWLVTLDRDADMSSVSAQFSEGLLRVTVRRRPMPEPLTATGGYRVPGPAY